MRFTHIAPNRQSTSEPNALVAAAPTTLKKRVGFPSMSSCVQCAPNTARSQISEVLLKPVFI